MSTEIDTLIGRQVVYNAGHPNAPNEQGMVTGVNSHAVFVNFGRGSTSAGCSPFDLTLLDGRKVSSLPVCPFCHDVHFRRLPCRHCGEPDIPDAEGQS